MSDEATDADVKAMEPSVLVKLASAVQAISGLFVALTGLQIVDLHFIAHPFLAALPYALIAAGVGLIGIATRVYRARTWAAIAACALHPLVVLVLVAWTFYSMGSVFSCVLLFAIAGSLLSSILALISLGGVRTAAAARDRLAAQGMNLGL